MADQYDVHITKYAYGQINEIRSYIGEKLSSPDAAKQLLESMKAAIGKLQFLPFRHALVEVEPWRTRGVRRLIIKKFHIYYWIDENRAKVHVTAVVYGKRNQVEQLAFMNSEEGIKTN